MDREIRALERVRGPRSSALRASDADCWCSWFVWLSLPHPRTQTEERTKIEIKKLAKIGEVNSAKILAKEIVQYGIVLSVCFIAHTG